MYTIEDLREGKVAVINDGTKKELSELLIEAFGDNDQAFTGSHIYYFKSFNYESMWACSSTSPYLPTQSVKDFLSQDTNEEEFKWGQKVEVYREHEWESGYVYIAKDPRSSKHVVALMKLNCFNAIDIEDIRKPLEKVKITMQDIADKFGCKAEQLVITGWADNDE